MVNTVYPIDNAGLFSGRMLRQALVSPTVAGATPARPLGGRSGVRPGTSPTTVTTPTATTWACAPHGGTVDVQPAAEAGTYGFAVDAAIGGGIPAANASNPRIDIVYDQLTDPAEGNGGSPKLETLYLAGTAAATPQAPTKPARSIVLAQINVPRAGGGNPTVTWVAPYTAGAGGVVDYPSKAALLADTPAVNSLGRDIVTGSTYAYHPGATPQASPFWLHVGGRPDFGAFTPVSVFVPDASRGLRAVAMGGRVYLEGAIRSATATFDKDATYVVGSIPVAFAPKRLVSIGVDLNRVLGFVTVDVDGTIRIRSTVGFPGVLDVSIDGLNWLDSRLS
jgi:hypothetical protein